MARANCIDMRGQEMGIGTLSDEFMGLSTDSETFEAVECHHVWYLPVKATVEWLTAFTLLVISSPLLLILAVLVKVTSPGPAFYAQTRLGRFGRKYRILKLRTMVHNAEAGTGPVWAAKGDCRITKVGKFLRLTHLDEVPQLWNVLRGEMSLIGPRPERPEIARRIESKVNGFHLRLSVRPGITGLAQMLLPADDPNDASMNCVRLKLAHDLYYVREVSPLVDLRIAFSTPCFFISAAIDAMRKGSLRSYGSAVERGLLENDGCVLAGDLRIDVAPPVVEQAPVASPARLRMPSATAGV